MICPRCSGHAISARDQHGAYIRCMICGHEQQDAEPAEYKSRHEAHHATDSRIPINMSSPRYAWARAYAREHRVVSD